MSYIEKRTRTILPFDITVLSRQMAQDYKPKDNAILVSISDDDTPPVKFAYEDKYLSILRVKFADITEPMRGLEPIYGRTAADIALFILKHAEKASQLVVHCEAGVSRSAGVAAAVSGHYGNEEAEQYFIGEPVSPNTEIFEFIETDNPFFANQRVYQMVLRAMNQLKESTNAA